MLDFQMKVGTSFWDPVKPRGCSRPSYCQDIMGPFNSARMSRPLKAKHIHCRHCSAADPVPAAAAGPATLPTALETAPLPTTREACGLQVGGHCPSGHPTTVNGNHRATGHNNPQPDPACRQRPRDPVSCAVLSLKPLWGALHLLLLLLPRNPQVGSSQSGRGSLEAQLQTASVGPSAEWE